MILPDLTQRAGRGQSLISGVLGSGSRLRVEGALGVARVFQRRFRTRRHAPSTSRSTLVGWYLINLVAALRQMPQARWQYLKFSGTGQDVLVRYTRFGALSFLILMSRSVDLYYRVPLLAGLRTVTLNSWGEVVQVISSVSVPWRPLALLPGHMETPQDSG
jgi:hypothetical protein